MLVIKAGNSIIKRKVFFSEVRRGETSEQLSTKEMNYSNLQPGCIWVIARKKRY